MKLRVGIVGLGEAWDSRYRPALRSLSDRFEVRAVHTEVAHLAEEAAREFHADVVDGFRALAQRDDVDAILMLSPNWYGALPILAACDAGKAVYCTVPLELDPIRAREIKERLDRSGVAFMAEFPRRFAPGTQRLKELIATRLGRPQLLFCHRRLSVAKANGNRRYAPHESASLRELMELVDWCRYVVGENPTTVIGAFHAAPDQVRGEDYQMMSLDFSPPGQYGAGPLAQISCGHYMPAAWHEAITFRPPSALQVCCERGIAFVDLPNSVVWFDEAGRHMESLDSERPVGEQLLTYFHRAVTSLFRKTSDLEDAFRALTVARLARESCTTGIRAVIEF